MKSCFLKRNGSAALRVFFQGWGFDEAAAAELKDAASSDVLVCFDYSDWYNALESILAQYQEHYLAAWSLGVYAAAKCWRNELPRPASALAINGTLRPIDAAFGIAPAIFEGTIHHWPNEAARKKFAARLTGNDRSIAIPCRRSWESQLGELEFLKDEILASAEPENCYTAAVIGGNDRIFPAGNQSAFWRERKIECREMAIPHAFFGKLPWGEVFPQ
ncbi:MAG: DUF452 family protein [Victivallaceae bacterium]|nr:DUF452 family protein [Victivallaceae bacterium]